MPENQKPKIYLAGDIMSHGSNLARQEEYDKFIEAGINADVYSPVMNKSINDKTSVTEEENNHLAEKITSADIGRLWESDCVVISPEQSAVGTLCELGCLYGWRYVAVIMDRVVGNIVEKINKDIWDDADRELFNREFSASMLGMYRMLADKAVFAHYFDIRTNHLNEKDWRRSFSINQLLYGMILDVTSDRMLNNSFDDVLPKLKEWISKLEESGKNGKNAENEG